MRKTRSVATPLLLATLLAGACSGPAPGPPGAAHADGRQAAAKAPAIPDHETRVQWFREARYGMFIHFGPFSQWSLKEWSQANHQAAALPRPERDKVYVQYLKPQRDCARRWAETAKKAGMKYMVFTAKHHEGFCLWDTQLTDYNSMRIGPGFDMVAEFVQAAREAGLGVGLYYSLGDGHHPDGRRCATDEAARRRFLDYTRGLVRELMTRYGRIDILWYDGPFPLGYAGEWEAEQMNAMVLRLQPNILINDRAMKAEDFTCNEGGIWGTQFPGQDWEACMTFNGIWTYAPGPPESYRTPRQIVEWLQQVSTGTGNLLLNVGPSPRDGSITPIEVERLTAVGKWLAQYGEATFGRLDRPEALGKTANNVGGRWTRRGNTAYLWIADWPKGDVVIRDVKATVKACRLLPDGRALAFEQADGRVTLRGLPKDCPDPIAGYGILKFDFAGYPR